MSDQPTTHPGFFETNRNSETVETCRAQSELSATPLLGRVGMEIKTDNQTEGDTSHSCPAICSAHLPICPQCGARIYEVNTNGTPEGVERYCEDCGWPDEDRTGGKTYRPKPRGLQTWEWVGKGYRFDADDIPHQKNFNRKLAEVITNQILEGRFDLEEIKVAAPNAKHPLFNDVPCDYGVRMRGQVERAIERIKADKDTRRAIVVTARPDDEKPPCIMLIQFLVRDGKVLTVAFMRSWDMLLGFAYDLHLYHALGKRVAAATGFEQGEAHVVVGSAHAYDIAPNVGADLQPRRKE